jgi:hypothetical protein
LLTEDDVGTTLDVKARATCNNSTGSTVLESQCPIQVIGDGKIGGGTDTPIEIPGNGNLPSGNDLADLNGIIYLQGTARQNSRKIQCNSGMNNVRQILTCDFRNGDCTPEDVCGGPFSNPNGDCSFPQSYFQNPTSDNNHCNNNDCQYQIKIQFILKSGMTTYPSNCAKGS